MPLGDFFSRAPTTAADVPIAAMRGLLRESPIPTAYSAQPKGRPNMTPPDQMRSTAPPMPPPLTFPQMKESNEWGDLGKQAMSLDKGFQEKPEDDKFIKNMREFDKQLAELRALRSTQGTNQPQVSPSNEPLDDATGDYVVRNASFESGNNPKAVNPGSGASGLFQFLPSTWRGIMQEDPSLGLTADGIFDVEQQKKAMNHYTRKSAVILNGVLGRKPTGGELYLLHLLGHSGGPAVLADINAPITSTIDPAAYRSNPFLKQYKTGRDLIAGLNGKFGG